MTQTPPIREKILNAAETRVRAVGFSEMSFRDVATDVGIKSASVHYHFPTKADLGNALVERYTERFRVQLDAIDQSNLPGALSQFVALYDEAFVLGTSICLCAILGAEAVGLPPSMSDRTGAFFEMNIAWLNELFAKSTVKDASGLAELVVAALEGAMIVASASKNRSIFETITHQIQSITNAALT